MLFSGMTVLSLLASVAACIGGNAGLHSLWLAPVTFIGTFLGLFLVVFLFLWVSTLLVDQKKPQENDSRFYRTLVDLYVDLALTIGQARVHVLGLEQTPKDGRFLLVCNHLSEADPAVLLKYFRKSQLAFISKRENDTMFLVGPLMHKILCQSINRENDREALKTILNCIRLIEEDKASVAVFPEGYIKPDRKLHHFRSGVFKIATKTNVPIVVCTLTNTLQVFQNFVRLKPTDIDLHLIKTIQPEEYAGMTTVEIADMVYRLMAEDLGPDRVAQEEEEIP